MKIGPPADRPFGSAAPGTGAPLPAIALIAWLSTVVPLPAAATERPDLPESITEGSLLSVAEDGSRVPLPLRHTEVHAEITGLVAHVRVIQTFENPSDLPIEAIYVFPLPNRAAVDDMEIRLDDRVIRGLIKKRDEAREVYETARRAGQTAALLDQERPNIFTQSVANILPGGSISVHLRYFETLADRSGEQEFVFPMVVGPRFIPGTPIGHSGSGRVPDTTEVADASRITPPALAPGERSGHDISLEVRLETGLPATEVASPSHKVTVEKGPAGPVRVRLSPDDAIPNRDFVMRYRLDGSKPNLVVLPHRAGEDGYFLALLRPEASPPPEAITPKEMIFVVDCSGSMSGEPIAKVREAMRYALENLDPLDNFQIIRFSDTAQAFAPEPVPATPAHVARALEYVDLLSGDGGTIMLEGVAAALSYPEDPQRYRIISFMTDGYIGNEDQILAYLRDHLESARLHSFGVGSSVNRYLLDRMAAFGGGSAEYILLNERSEEAVRRFYDRLRSPYLTHITIDWAGLPIADLYPARIPDLFLGEPILLSGRYRRPGDAEVTVRGRIGGRPYEGRFRVRLPEREPAGDAIATLWARARIEELSDRLVGRPDPEIVAQITATALDHHLVSAYTSFVAVQERISNTTGQLETIAVPVPVPAGVDPEKAVQITDGVSTFSAEYVDGLPILGRNFQEILTLAPGVTDVDGDANPNIHGARDTDIVLKEHVKVRGKTEVVETASVPGVVGGVVGGVLGGVAGGMLEGVKGANDAIAVNPNPGSIEVFCSLWSPKREFGPREPIEIVLTIHNGSAAPVRLPDPLSVAFGSARFEIRDSRGLLLVRQTAGTPLLSERELPPGDSLIYRLRLDGPGGYRIPGPGVYSIVFLGSDIGLTDSTRLMIVIK